MSYAQVVARLGFTSICLDGHCGITWRSHRTGFVFLNVAHFAERRVSKRGLRKFLLLVAKRDRLASPDFLNDPALYYIHWYLDERKADEWAAQLGVRFPIHFSLPERRSVSLVPGLSRKSPAIWAWARRGT